MIWSFAFSFLFFVIKTWQIINTPFNTNVPVWIQTYFFICLFIHLPARLFVYPFYWLMLSILFIYLWNHMGWGLKCLSFTIHIPVPKWVDCLDISVRLSLWFVLVIPCLGGISRAYNKVTKFHERSEGNIILLKTRDRYPKITTTHCCITS